MKLKHLTPKTLTRYQGSSLTRRRLAQSRWLRRMMEMTVNQSRHPAGCCRRWCHTKTKCCLCRSCWCCCYLMPSRCRLICFLELTCMTSEALLQISDSPGSASTAVVVDWRTSRQSSTTWDYPETICQWSTSQADVAALILAQSREKRTSRQQKKDLHQTWHGSTSLSSCCHHLQQPIKPFALKFKKIYRIPDGQQIFGLWQSTTRISAIANALYLCSRKAQFFFKYP